VSLLAVGVGVVAVDDDKMASKAELVVVVVVVVVDEDKMASKVELEVVVAAAAAAEGGDLTVPREPRPLRAGDSLAWDRGIRAGPQTPGGRAQPDEAILYVTDQLGHRYDPRSPRSG
jgi:hypothetical protein